MVVYYLYFVMSDFFSFNNFSGKSFHISINAFLFPYASYIFQCTCVHDLFNQCSVDGHLGNFQSLAITRDDVVNNLVLYMLFHVWESVAVG